MNQAALPSPRIARLTAAQVHAMLDAGILEGAEALELIDGLLVHKNRAAQGKDPMTIGERHNLVIKLLARLDPELVPLGAHMQTQGPVCLSDHDEPEPDGAIVVGDPRDYVDRLPSADDVVCIIEVADSSLEFDRTTKLALYAKAGIPQYVIVNLRETRLEVHQDPLGASYARCAIVTAVATVDLRATTSSSLTVAAKRLLP